MTEHKSNVALIQVGNPDEVFVTSEQAAAMLGVKAKTIRDWSYQGRFARYRAGRKALYRKRDIQAQLQFVAPAIP